MATPEGTFTYRDEHAEKFARAYFRRAGDCVVSSIGIGTRTGAPTAAVDQTYEAAIQTAIDAGCNVVHAAPADRHQRSQRAVGRAMVETDVQRESLFLCAGGGRIPFDGIRPDEPDDHVERVYVSPGILDRTDLVHGSHAIAPEFVADQVDRSRSNFGVETLDAFFLETPEVHLDERSRETVYEMLQAAFETLEERVAAGHIDGYGVSTWDGFRVRPENDRYLSLPEVISRARAAAEAVGTATTHLRYIAVPFNIRMADAYTIQAHEGSEGPQSALWFAAEAGIDVFATSPLAGGALTTEGAIPASVGDRLAGETPAQQALNFARSAPGVTAVLAGSRTSEYARENARAGQYPPLGADAFDATFA